MSTYVLDRLGRAKWNSLPKAVIEGIVNHMYMDYRASLPELSEGGPYFRRLNMGPLANAMHLYFLMIFSKRLDELALISEKWAAVVSEHPFYQEICQIITHRSYSINSKAAQPTNRDLAKQQCWLCALFIQIPDMSDNQRSGRSISLPPFAVTYHRFANIGSIPVCKSHSEMDICQHCLMQDDRTDDEGGINLVELDDSVAYGISWVQVCEACRKEAIYRDTAIKEIGLDWFSVGAACDYVMCGAGSVAKAVEGMLTAAWLEGNRNFRRLRSEMLLLWKQDKAKYKDGGRRKDPEEWIDGGGCTERQLDEIIEEMLRQDACRLVKLGIWILPELYVEPPQQSQGKVEIYRPGVALHTPAGDVKTSTVDIADRIPWTGAPDSLLKRYSAHIRNQLFLAVREPLMELQRMLVATSIDLSESAGRRAEQMTDDDLINWLHDPRIYVSNWWSHNHDLTSMANDGKRRKAYDEASGDDRPRKFRRLDQDQQIGYTSLANAESDTDSKESERNAYTSEPASAPPQPKDALDTRDYEHYRTYLAKQPINHLVIPTKGHQVPTPIKQIIQGCWTSITKNLRKCQCGICARRDKQERIEAEERRRRREEEQRQKEVDAERFMRLKRLLQASRQDVPPTIAPATEITITKNPDLDSYTGLDELSELEDEVETLSDDDSYDDDSDEKDDTI